MNRIYNDAARQTNLSKPSGVLPLTFIHRFIMFFTQFNKNFLLKIFISFYHKKYPLNVDLVFF